MSENEHHHNHSHSHNVSGKNLFITIILNIIITLSQIIGGILLFFIIILSILGYYLTRNDFSNPPEHYVSIGKRVYTTAPAMMIDE